MTTTITEELGLEEGDLPIAVLMSMVCDAWLAVEKDKSHLQPVRPDSNGEELAAFIYGHVERCGNSDLRWPKMRTGQNAAMFQHAWLVGPVPSCGT